MTEATRRQDKVRATMLSITTALRRLHVELDLPLDDVVIEVHPTVWKEMATRPDMVQTMRPHVTRWNELMVGGVIIREAEPGNRETEDLMLKRGMIKMWVAGKAR